MNERFRFYDEQPIDVEYRVQEETPGKFHAVEQKTHSIRLNVILFIATFITTTLAGALTQAAPNAPFFSQVHKGLPFSITLLMILLFHEFGHYFMAKKHHVDASLPYFIPAPSFIGTFGAVIKMRSPLRSKRALLDIGAAGPLAGIIIAIPATIIGLYLSEINVVTGTQGGISLGSSLLFSLLARLSVGSIPENYDIFLHPVAFAGWIGMLVTMINLFPVGQLDGGHISYAILGNRRHRKIGTAMLPILFFLGMLPVPKLLGTLLNVFGIQLVTANIMAWLDWIAGYGWIGWLIWYALLRYLITTKHPPTMDEYSPLDLKRKIIGWIALVLFVLTFTPSPFII